MVASVARVPRMFSQQVNDFSGQGKQLQLPPTFAPDILRPPQGLMRPIDPLHLVYDMTRRHDMTRGHDLVNLNPPLRKVASVPMLLNGAPLDSFKPAGLTVPPNPSSTGPSGPPVLPMIGKFHSQQSEPERSKEERKGKVPKSYNKSKINYPIHKLSTSESPGSIPLDKLEMLKDVVYPLVEIKRYSTSTIDPARNYLTVFQFPVNNHWVIWDYETGFVHLTGIWKASSSSDYIKANAKADIVKLLESTPKRYQSLIKRIRGGFLKIQGTWLPFNLCRILARRFCYNIRYELIPLFGLDFPDYCLTPDDRGYGELKLDEVNEQSVPVPTSEESDEPRFIMNSKPSDFSPSSKHKKSKIKKERKMRSSFDRKMFFTPSQAYPVNSSHNVSLPVPHSSQPIQPYNLSPHSLSPQTQQNHHTPTPYRVYTSSAPRYVNIGSVELTPSPTQKTLAAFSPEYMYDPSTPMTQVSPSWQTLAAPSRLSYNDMVDIVNASKCLQSLSGNSGHSPVSLRSTPQKPHNYIAISEDPRGSPNGAKNVTKNAIENGGISSILLAAGLSEAKEPYDQQQFGPPLRRKVSMKINDLLT